jgi:hypothetical protein
MDTQHKDKDKIHANTGGRKHFNTEKVKTLNIQVSILNKMLRMSLDVSSTNVSVCYLLT